jgi:N-carbamoyl-L-amino-acid hydrolase
MNTTNLRINPTRFLAAMTAQAEIGTTGDGGVSRPALSEADMQIRAWFRDRVREAGLVFHEDGAGNLSAVLNSKSANAKTLLIGSHLDSVKRGGRFDGPLGVLSALEVVRTLHENEVQLPFHLECISFTDEEGTHLPELGSGALAGTLTRAMLDTPRDPAAFADGLARAGLSIDGILSAKRDPASLLGYIEVHIEQGTRLIDAGHKIGVVSSIVGIRAFRLIFHGEAAHAGTMPIPDRRDAFLAAADFALRSRRRIHESYAPGVTTVGQVEVAPGAFNIVPGRASLSVEYRHGDTDALDAMGADLHALANQVADEHRVELEVVPLVSVEPAVMDPTLMDHVRASADALDLPHTTLMSFAGHDPQNTARVMPSAMFFVPSVDGISHNPREYTSDEDCVNAANVLLHSVVNLAAANQA